MSLAIDDTPQVMEITGLSIAARAEIVDDPAEGEKRCGCCSRDIQSRTPCWARCRRPQMFASFG
ncbi:MULTISPECIES: hypothetical protein [Bradyrhizobium]|uniref:hypothetical protein n=1 Tax=Bradyrhizobium TaxID=374 RepID=UPI0004BAEA94|nr:MULTISPECIES: hypothetical protein [Bradyrhizobium]MDI2111455.1 hypothetical protein [Bradyrhizobium sp. Mp64]